MRDQVILAQKVNIHATGAAAQVAEDLGKIAGETVLKDVQMVTGRRFFDPVY